MADQTDHEPVLDLLSSMTAYSLETSGLDLETLLLVRLGALVAVDAPSASYLMNLGVAGESGIEVEQVQGVLAAVAPIAGAPRVLSAVTKMAEAMDIKINLGQAQGS